MPPKTVVKIYKTPSGKKYILIGKRKIYLDKKITNKDIGKYLSKLKKKKTKGRVKRKGRKIKTRRKILKQENKSEDKKETPKPTKPPKPLKMKVARATRGLRGVVPGIGKPIPPSKEDLERIKLSEDRLVQIEREAIRKRDEEEKILKHQKDLENKEIEFKNDIHNKVRTLLVNSYKDKFSTLSDEKLLKEADGILNMANIGKYEKDLNEGVQEQNIGLILDVFADILYDEINPDILKNITKFYTRDVLEKKGDIQIPHKIKILENESLKRLLKVERGRAANFSNSLTITRNTNLERVRKIQENIIIREKEEDIVLSEISDLEKEEKNRNRVLERREERKLRNSRKTSGKDSKHSHPSKSSEGDMTELPPPPARIDIPPPPPARIDIPPPPPAREPSAPPPAREPSAPPPARDPFEVQKERRTTRTPPPIDILADQLLARDKNLNLNNKSKHIDFMVGDMKTRSKYIKAASEMLDDIKRNNNLASKIESGVPLTQQEELNVKSFQNLHSYNEFLGVYSRSKSFLPPVAKEASDYRLSAAANRLYPPAPPSPPHQRNLKDPVSESESELEKNKIDSETEREHKLFEKKREEGLKIAEAKLKKEENEIRKKITKLEYGIGIDNEKLTKMVERNNPLDQINITIIRDRIRRRTNDVLAFKRQLEVGRGKSGGKGGLYNDQIEEVMDKYPPFLGVIARDEVKNLLPRIGDKKLVCWIMNTDPAAKPGLHWVAVLIDARSNGAKTVEFYNSFADKIPNDIMKEIKIIVDKINPDTLLKYKENHVVQQRATTDNCGYFAMRFLIDRLNGKDFAEATGYNDELKHHAVLKNEQEIERMKKLPAFKYLGQDN